MWSRYVMSQVKHNSYFLTGAVLGLWVSLCAIPLEEEGGVRCLSRGPALPVPDEFEPVLEERGAVAGGGGGGGERPAPRSLQRPRYYTTELGMRGSVLTGVLSSEGELAQQVPALNRTLARLQPALKFFITARAQHAPALPNVVGFTDTREMLKPFHALKYLADNFLEEYDFFFLVSDATFVNTRRLAELASSLSVGRHVYMGQLAAPDSQYCDLDGGILLSNSVLRAVHAELEWCVRNSYSPHHHENLGRCVLHAANLPCHPAAQGETYTALQLAGDEAPPALLRAVTARPARGAALPRLHALVARQHLQQARAERARLRAQLRRTARSHPPQYRNATWPAGLRGDPGLAPPPPEDRHSHARWTAFNATHALMPDETRACAPLDAAHAAALRLVLGEAEAWARRRWPDVAAVELAEGARRWEPAQALRYRLVLRLHGAEGAVLRQVEAVRALGAARLVAAPYVTESARVTLVAGVTSRAQAEARALLARVERLLQQDGNVRVLLAGVLQEELRADAAALLRRHPLAVECVPLELQEEEMQSDAELELAAGGAALAAAARRLPRDALLLLAPPHLDFNQDFLNRVRMNTIPGWQWFSPLPFARHSQYGHPRFLAADGSKPTVHTGRFRRAVSPLLSVAAGDVLDASARRPAAPAWDALAAAALRCVRAPEPGAVLAPRAAPAAPALRSVRRAGAAQLELGERAQLARLLLELQSEAL